MDIYGSTNENKKRLDWPRLLRSLAVPFVTEGKNTKPGSLSIKCPICSFSDPSEHLVINPRTNKWFCWRNKDHFGRNPVYLVQLIGRLSEQQAKELIDNVAEGEDSTTTLSSEDMAEMLRRGPVKREPFKFAQVSFPDDIKPILSRSVSALRFLDYLKGPRKFDRCAVRACERYDLHYCLSGDWAHRLIIPIYKNSEMIGWTGRSTLAKPRLRYDTFPLGDATKRMLFNSDKCKGGKVLFVVEGPFDCLKVDLFAHKMDCNSCATLGTNTTPAQIAELHKLASRYDLVVVLFDPAAESQAMGLRSELTACGCPIKIGKVEDGAEDPGDMRRKQVRKLVKRYLRSI